MPAQLETKIIVRATTASHTRTHWYVEPRNNQIKYLYAGKNQQRGTANWQSDTESERGREKQQINVAQTHRKSKLKQILVGYPAVSTFLGLAPFFWHYQVVDFCHLAAELQLENFCRQTAARMCTAGCALKSASLKASKQASSISRGSHCGCQNETIIKFILPILII